MNKQNRDVTSAALHNPIHVPVLGSIKNSQLDLNTKEFIRPIKMTLMDGYVEVDLVNGQGKSATVLIPLTNFISLTVKKDPSAKDNKA